MEEVRSLEAARSWFLNHSEGSVKCVHPNGAYIIANSFPEAETFFRENPEKKEVIDPAVGVHMWRIWSNQHKGWWAPARSGYTQSKSAAGLYTFDEACEIVSGANKMRGDFDFPYEAMIRVEGSEFGD